MNKHPLNHVIRLVALLLFCSVARADFPYVTFTNSFKAAELSDSYTNFNWTLNDFTDYQISVRFDTVGYSNVIFRMAYPQGGNAYLTLYGGIVTTNTTSTLYTASIDHTNIPRNASYFAEFLAANINVSTNYVTNYTPVRILSKGKVETKWSVFSATNNVQTNINIQLHVGTNISLSESDPIWSAEKAGYVTTGRLDSVISTSGYLKAETDYVFTNWLATNGYVQSEADPVFTNWLATNTSLTTETDPIFTNWLSTNTYVESESDPIWIAASNGVGTNLVNLLANSTAMQAFTNTHTYSDSYTNYAFRNVYQVFTANYASALSSTGFAVRTVYQAFTAAYATANSTTNFMPFIQQNVSNAAMAVRLTGVETNLSATRTSVVYRTGGIISGPVTNDATLYLGGSDNGTLRFWDGQGGVWAGLEISEQDLSGLHFYYDGVLYGVLDQSGNIPFARISSALVGETVRLGSLTLAMQQYGATVLTNGEMATTNEWNYTGNASWGAASNITFAAGAGTATYIYTNNITVPGAWLLTYSHNTASGTNYITNWVGGTVQGVATSTTIPAVYSNWCYVRNQTLDVRGTPGDSVYLDNFTLRRDTNGDVRAANRLDAYQLFSATRPMFQNQPAAYSAEVAQVRTDIGTASNALNIVITNVSGNLNVASNALNIAQTNTAANLVTVSNRAEAAYTLADSAPTYAEASNSYVLATGESRAITLGGKLTVTTQAVFGVGSVADGICSTVSGGKWNSASAEWSTVSGGLSNSASADSAVVSGGQENNANGTFSTVAGGNYNSASGNNSFIGGGNYNTASGDTATISGGGYNGASAAYSSVNGGYNNLAAGYAALAAGFRAKATNDGAFVWADSVDADKGQGGGANSATFHASGGFYHVDGTNILASNDGELTMNGEAIVSGTVVDTNLYAKLDGTTPFSAPIPAGGYGVTNIAWLWFTNATGLGYGQDAGGTNVQISVVGTNTWYIRLPL